MELRVINGPKGRFYVTPQDIHYPSITTILGAEEKPYLEAWRQSLGPLKAATETKRAGDRGTAVHDMIERLLKNEPNPTQGYPAPLVGEFNSLKLHLKRIDNILAQEIALYSDALKVAGRVDCIAEWDGVLSIVDFKTSSTPKTEDMVFDYFLQTTAYSIMFEEMYGIAVDQIVILMSVERGVVPLIFTKQAMDYFEPLVVRIHKYYASKR
jgi:genome maintenance exonuclease 1